MFDKQVFYLSTTKQTNKQTVNIDHQVLL